MRILIFILLIFLFSGCNQMSRQATIAAAAECEKGGMNTKVLYNYDESIRDIQCLPKKGE